jgi:DNA polymerase-4
VIEPLSLDEAYLDLSGSREARAEPEAVGRRLKAEVMQATGGLTASVGVAAVKSVAKIASEYQKPDGLVVVWPGTERAFLAPMPVRVLPGLGPAAERRLEGLGLKTVGDLAATPIEVLAARLGSSAEALQAMAIGDDPRAVSVPGLPKSISREVTFERDVRDRDSLRRTVRTLAQDVTQSLRRNGMWARTVRLKVRFEGFDTHTFQSTLATATDLDEEVLATADRLLAEALAQPRPVRLIGIGAAGLSEATQDGLFDQDRGRRRSLDSAMDQLRRRFGPQSVHRGQIVIGEQRDFRRDDLDTVTRDRS